MGRRRVSRPIIQRWGDWEGQEVVGRIADIRENDFGKLIDIRTADGILTFGLTTVLESLLRDVPRGTRIWVTCTGKQRNKAGKEFFCFDVDVDMPEEPVDVGVSEVAANGTTPVHTVPAAEYDADIRF